MLYISFSTVQRHALSSVDLRLRLPYHCDITFLLASSDQSFRMTVPGLSEHRRPGTETSLGAASDGGRCARSVRTSQTWNGGMPWNGFWRREVCQVSRESAHLERWPARERPLTGVGVPGLPRKRIPETVACLGVASDGGGCARSVEDTQTWNAASWCGRYMLNAMPLLQVSRSSGTALLCY